MDTAEGTETVTPTRKKPKLTKVLILATVASSFGLFQCGYSIWLVFSPAAIIIQFCNSTFEGAEGELQDPQFDDRLLALTTSIFPLGALAGILLLSIYVDRWGRKCSLLLNNGVNIIATVLAGLSRIVKSNTFGITGRFVNGMASGAFTCVVLLYIVEISPLNFRGALHMVSILFLTLGLLLAQLLDLYEALGNEAGFPFLMSIIGIIAIFNIVLLQFPPESPRFLLIQKGKEQEARKALKLLRGTDDVEEEIEEMNLESHYEKTEKNMRAYKLLFFPPLRQYVILAIVLMTGGQLTGVNMVYFYAEGIYITLGVNAKDIRFLLIGLNGGLHLMTLVTMFSIDSVGRRGLLLGGFISSSLMCILLALCLELKADDYPSLVYLSGLIIVVYLSIQMIGPGPIPFLLTGELFLQSSRGSAYVIGIFINWVARFLILTMYIYVEPRIGPLCLLLFWPACVAVFIYIFQFLPETKCKTFVEIRKAVELRLQKKQYRKRKTKLETRDLN